MKRIAFVSFVLPLALGFAVASAACSSDDASGTTSSSSGSSGASPDSGGAGGNTDGGSPDTSTPADSGATEDSGGACNTLANTGSQVAEVAGSGTKPTPQGGTIEDGTYVLTKHEVYPPSSPDENTRKRVWRFAAGKFETVNNDANKPESRISGTFTTNGSGLELTVACPAGLSGAALPYTATGNTIIMFHQASQNDVYTYTKQ